jgi:hypothetical protein
MLSFKQYFLNEAETSVEKLKHLSHLEEFLYHGVNSIRDVINTLRDTRDILAGHGNPRTSIQQITIKIDGAPSIVAGYLPTDAKTFFVAKKSVFNKNPKYYTTSAEIDADKDLSAELNQKFKSCLKWLPEVIPQGQIYQGDLLHTKTDLASELIDGKQCWVMHPNTLVYAVEQTSHLGKIIGKSQLGIVFHTRYTGSTLESLKASFDVTTDDLLKSDNVWAIGPEIPDLSGIATMPAADTKDVTALLSVAGKLFQKIGSTILSELANHPELIAIIETYNNTHIRNGQFITNSKAHVDGLIDYIHQKYQKEIDARSSDKGKQTQIDKRDTILSFFDDTHKEGLVMFFDMMVAIVNAKIKIIEQLNKINLTKTFVKTKDGFVVPASGEGFVISDKSGKIIKLVDRLEFSANNFSTSILKGWEKK